MLCTLLLSTLVTGCEKKSEVKNTIAKKDTSNEVTTSKDDESEENELTNDETNRSKEENAQVPIKD